MNARAAGLAVGFLADAALGDPQRGHPVAGFGQVATWLERRSYADRRAAGVLHVVLLVGGVSAGGLVLERRASGPVGRAVLTATATWCVLGGRSLHREALEVERLLAEGDLSAARVQVGRLVGRSTRDLSATDVTRATVESVAENTSDAVVAPLLWTAVAGVPGALGYRAVNTLDAMIGHRSARYREFGWAAARLDDLANLTPARVCAALATLAAPMVGGRPCEGARAWRTDARRHPSPNAGPVEAAFAGALSRSLGGRNDYGGTVEDRGTLGDGPAPGQGDIARTVRLARVVDVLALLAALGVSVRRRL